MTLSVLIAAHLMQRSGAGRKLDRTIADIVHRPEAGGDLRTAIVRVNKQIVDLQRAGAALMAKLLLNPSVPSSECAARSQWRLRFSPAEGSMVHVLIGRSAAIVLLAIDEQQTRAASRLL